MFFYPCENDYDMTLSYCIVGCYLWTNTIATAYEQFAHDFVPLLLIAIMSMVLILRILWQKHRLGVQITWKKDRKMVLQLVSVTGLFLICNLGFFVIRLGQYVWDSNFGEDAKEWFTHSFCLSCWSARLKNKSEKS